MASQARTASVTSSWVALADLPGTFVSIKNKTGADLYVRLASETTSGYKSTLADGESLHYAVNANAKEVEISAVASGPAAGVNYIVSDKPGNAFTGGASAVTGTVSLTDISAGEYETVAASQTDQALGATGATGDYLAGVLIVPGTTAAGAVSIKDGAGSAISIFAGGGTTALITLIPFFVPLGIKSLAGAWKVTTGANVTAIGVGNFT